MANQKINPDNKLTPKELAEQLREPIGEIGKEVGKQMNEGNRHICLNSYKLLNPKKGDKILEVGMGNGFFVKDLFDMVSNLNYVGVDYSSTMVNEAALLNKEFIDLGKVEFKQASIEKLPFENNVFDCFTTTNTLYFWPHPENNLKEVLRVLKPGGKLLIAYRPKSLMDQIELSKFGFEKYEANEVEHLLNKSGFNDVNSQIIEEPELEFDEKSFKMIGIYTMGNKI